MKKRNILVLGGSRFLGLQLIRKLIDQGENVTVFNRGTRPDSVVPEGTRIVHGDRNSFEDYGRIENIVYDAIFDFSGYTPTQAKYAIERFKNRVIHFVYCSTAAAYAEPKIFPLTEESPLGNWSLWGSYGVGKKESEDVLWRAFSEKELPLTVVRPVYILGSANFLDREAFLFRRLLAEAPILLPGDGNALIQFAFANEVVESLISIIDKPSKSIGNAYNSCSDEFISLRGLVELAGEIANKKPHIHAIELENYGIDSVPYDAQDIFPFGNAHFVCSNLKAKTDLEPNMMRSLQDNLQLLYEWYSANYDLDTFSPNKREAAIVDTLH